MRVTIKFAVKAGQVYRRKPVHGHTRYIRIVRVSSKQTGQPKALYVDVSRSNKPKRGRYQSNGWSMPHSTKEYPADTWLQYRDGAWRMPEGFEEEGGSR